MSEPLWTISEIIAATGATTSPSPHGLHSHGERVGVRGGSESSASPDPLAPELEAAPHPNPLPAKGRGEGITGVSIDTRSIEPGNLFVALKDIRDGHEFVTTAFKNGAAAALVSNTYQRHPGDGPLLHVENVLKALEALGLAARARLSADARVIAVTGSVGKTTTKEMLRACLSPLGKTHAADKSFNNHWGVPLTLARMPADTKYGVFEIGMNHAGEITPLTKMVRPHVAIITTVEAVHLEHFKSVDDIAVAKAEIFSGLVPGGTAILNFDNPHFARLATAAEADPGIKIAPFSGRLPTDDELDQVTDCKGTCCGRAHAVDGVTLVKASLRKPPFGVEYVLGVVGQHMVMNSLAVLTALQAVGADAQAAIRALASFGAPQGRGSRTTLPINGRHALLIDESYNANPASMRAAFAAMGHGQSTGRPSRLIAVLGDMLELGPDSAALHAGLAESILANGVDLVFACGPNMRHL
ncbi:MAG: UDP-N-acetylmuramoyl-tripeptide--D-alanyl-D-alanine ligase, partial [Hyphomicrobiaceae bacterium]